MTTPTPTTPADFEQLLPTLSNRELGELHDSLSKDLMTSFREASKSYIMVLQEALLAIQAELDSRKSNAIGTCDKCGSTTHSISNHSEGK